MVTSKQLLSNTVKYYQYRLPIKLFFVTASFFLFFGLAGVSLSFRNLVFQPLIQPAWRDVPTEDIVRMRYLNQRQPVDFGVKVVCERTLNPVDGSDGGVFDRCNIGERKPIPEHVARHNENNNITATHTNEMLAKGWGLFLPRLTSEEKMAALQLLLLLTTVLEKHRVTYFLTAGSLLGLTRHGGMIPWDDDMDIGVDWRHRDAARKALSCVEGFEVRLIRPFQWWFRSERQDFPWIHVFLYDADDRFVWALTPHITNTFVYLRGNVFPLTTAEYEGCVAVPVPGKMPQVVTRIYSYWHCRAEEKHRGVKRLSRIPDGYSVETLPCSDLTRYYRMNLSIEDKTA